MRAARQIIEIEKKYKCIGGEKIHRLVEEQHQLTEDVGSVVHLVKTIKETGQGVVSTDSRGLAIGYHVLICADLGLPQVDPATGEVSSGNLMVSVSPASHHHELATCPPPRGRGATTDAFRSHLRDASMTADRVCSVHSKI
jgi:hypothetical protein